MDTLDVDEMMAQLLVPKASPTWKKSPMSNRTSFCPSTAFDEGTAEELQARARDYLEAGQAKALENARALGVEDSLINSKA
jgi:N utilization substance protein A